MNILENNKLIAEFMGADITTNKDFIYMSISMCDSLNIPNNCGAVNPIHLKYHTSWDWLMPVIKNILDWMDKQDGESIILFLHHLPTCDIEKSYEGVVEFISRYNK